MNLQKINYQKELEKLLTRLEKEEKVPTLLLHSCCAPCSSYVLEYLSQYFKITVFYYNPNIYPESEYTKRILEQQKLIEEMHFRYPVSFLAGKYDRDRFYEMAKGLEEVREGGSRCMGCYELRLKESAEIAVAGGFDYFTTTLSIAAVLIRIFLAVCQKLLLCLGNLDPLFIKYPCVVPGKVLIVSVGNTVQVLSSCQVL